MPLLRSPTEESIITIMTTTTFMTMTTITITIITMALEQRVKMKNTPLKKLFALSWPFKTIPSSSIWDTSLKIWYSSVLSGDMIASMLSFTKRRLALAD